jgi:hypothetical protein
MLLAHPPLEYIVINVSADHAPQLIEGVVILTPTRCLSSGTLTIGCACVWSQGYHHVKVEHVPRAATRAQ